MIATRREIIKHMMPLVSSEGWSEYTLQKVAAKLNATEDEVKLLFPEGVKDCVVIFLSEEDRALAETLPTELLAHLSLPEKMEKIIMTRLLTWLPEREIIKHTVSFNSLPWNTVWALKALYNSVDRMWRMAGDVTSTRVNLYTKRMTLAGVYNATLAFWLEDNSPDLEATSVFLKRQLYSEVGAFGYFTTPDPAASRSSHVQSKILYMNATA